VRIQLRFWWQHIMQHRRAIGVTVLTLVVAIANGRSNERRDDDKFCLPNKPVENNLGRVGSIC
jgi:hypothetical protein